MSVGTPPPPPPFLWGTGLESRLRPKKFMPRPGEGNLDYFGNTVWGGKAGFKVVGGREGGGKGVGCGCEVNEGEGDHRASSRTGGGCVIMEGIT